MRENVLSVFNFYLKLEKRRNKFINFKSHKAKYKCLKKLYLIEKTQNIAKICTFAVCYTIGGK